MQWINFNKKTIPNRDAEKWMQSYVAGNWVRWKFQVWAALFSKLNENVESALNLVNWDSWDRLKQTTSTGYNSAAETSIKSGFEFIYTVVLDWFKLCESL